MEKVNIVVGRFQPFTAGHYKLIEAAKKKGLPSVICMINPKTLDERHPFPVPLMQELYSGLFQGNNDIIDIIPVSSANLGPIAKILKGMGYQVASWTCGTDRFKQYNAMANAYIQNYATKPTYAEFKDCPLADDFEVIEIQRGDEDISATKVRNALLNNDQESFDAMMPTGARFDKDILYLKLKDQIDKVYNKSDDELSMTNKVETSNLYNKKRKMLEMRVLRLERKIYRLYNEDAFDDELDSLADDYAKDNFSDFEDELDKEITAIAKKNYAKYSTISKWLDEISEEEKFKDFRPTIGIESAIQNLKRELNSLAISGNKFGLSRTKELQKDIEEISNLSAVKANYKLVKEIQLKLKDFELQREQAYDKLLKDTESLTKYIRSLVPSRLFNITNKKNKYSTSIIMKDRNGKLIGTIDIFFDDSGDQNKIYEIDSNLVTSAGYSDERQELVSSIDEYKDLYVMDDIHHKLNDVILNNTLLPCANMVAQTAANNQPRNFYPDVIEGDELYKRDLLSVYAKVMRNGGTMLAYKVTYNNDSDDFTVVRDSPRNNFKITSKSLDEIRRAVDLDSSNLY